MRSHYNKTYYNWQKKAGEYGAQQDLWLYEEFVRDNDEVLDFGCGGGYMLEKLRCGKKYGVDINPFARAEAQEKSIKVFSTIEDIPQNITFDVIISHHTLEHIENPAEILKELRRRLKKTGQIICITPIDDWRIEKKFAPHDINKHLYTWTPLLLGNLFVICGYKIKKIDIVERAWLPLSRYYYRLIPRFIYRIASTLWSKLMFSRQIRIIATN